MYSNSSGSSNVAIGTNALYNNAYGGNLVAIGDSALYNNGTPPLFNLSAGNYIII